MRFDLRVPPGLTNTTFEAQYSTMLEMAEWADDRGFSTIALSEHHGEPAGFMSAPITVAAAVLSRTPRVNVVVAAALAPLHDPVRLAEQLAVVDLVAPGRISVILGAGYRRAEFEMAGVRRSRRGPLLEECAEVLRKAWTGEPFEWRGREVQVTPTPATPGGPRVSLGGKSPAAAQRAARLGFTFSPAVGDPAIIGAYFDEAARLGFDGAEVDGYSCLAEYIEGHRHPKIAPGFVMVSEDPEEAWGRIAALALYDAETYKSWQDDVVHSDWAVMDADRDADVLRRSGRYVVLTPDECVELAKRDGGLLLHPLMGGIEPSLAWESLELIDDKVLPFL